MYKRQVSVNTSNKDAENHKIGVESALNGINVDNFPKTKRKGLKKFRHSSKKVFSKDLHNKENVPEAIRRRKLGGKEDNTKLKDQTDNEEPNFNTAAYHKKQHEI